VISSSQRPLPDNTQHSQQTNIYAPGGIRTHDISRRTAVDLRLRPRGYWDRLPRSAGFKLNGTHQLLAYADDVNILGGSIHNVKENAEALVAATREIGTGSEC